MHTNHHPWTVVMHASSGGRGDGIASSHRRCEGGRRDGGKGAPRRCKATTMATATTLLLLSTLLTISSCHWEGASRVRMPQSRSTLTMLVLNRASYSDLPRRDVNIPPNPPSPPSIHSSIHLYAPISFAASLLPHCISSHPCSAITNAARTKPYALAPTVTDRPISPCPTSQPPLNGSPAPPQPHTDTDTHTNRLAAHPITFPQPVLATHPPAPTEHGRDERVHAPYPGRGRWCCRPQHGWTA